MKKLCNLFIFWLCAVLSFAQIQVVSTGNVGVGDTISADKKLFVYTIGNYDSGIHSYIKSSKQWGPAISAHAEFLNVTPENSSTINSCGQVKITSNGSLDVHNGGVVKIKNLSMENGSTLHVH